MRATCVERVELGRIVSDRFELCNNENEKFQLQYIIYMGYRPCVYTTRIPKNTYPVCTEHALSEYCWHSVLHTLSSLSSLTEAEPEMLMHACINNNIVAVHSTRTETFVEAHNRHYCRELQLYSRL